MFKFPMWRQGPFQCLLISVGLFVLACNTNNIQPKAPVKETAYENAMRVLAAEGSAQARDLLESDLEKTGDERSLFGLAWTAFIQMKYNEAEQIGQHILEGNPDPKMQAACHLLLGQVHTYTGRHPQAIKFFQTALEIYTTLDQPENLYRVHLGLANVYLREKDALNSKKHLNNAYYLQAKRGSPISHLGDYYHLKARLAFLEKNIEAGKNFSQKQMDIYESSLAEGRLVSGSESPEDLRGLANALSDLAFFLVLEGSFEEAAERIETSNQLFERVGEADKSYWNTVKTIMMLRCRNDNAYLAMVGEVNTFAVSSKDALLQDMLAFALSWECP